MELSGIDCFSVMDGNIEDSKMIYLKNWYIMPIKLMHNVECYGFLVRSKVEDKMIAYITDTTYIANLPINKLDCLILETNWDEDIALQKASECELQNNGFKNHLSLQQVRDYLCRQNAKVKKLVMAHTSNSGLFDGTKAMAMLKPFANEIYVATKNLKIEV